MNENGVEQKRANASECERMSARERASESDRPYFSFFFLLRNTVTGKMHQKISLYRHVRLAHTKEKFLQYANNPNFIDFQHICPTASLCLLDGLSVKCRNLPMISARVYR